MMTVKVVRNTIHTTPQVTTRGYLEMHLFYVYFVIIINYHITLNVLIYLSVFG